VVPVRLGVPEVRRWSAEPPVRHRILVKPGQQVKRGEQIALAPLHHLKA
jgi:hypothetical protein